jgi:hypothetical protein
MTPMGVLRRKQSNDPFDAWPAEGAMLLHPAFGLVEWDEPLPLEERHLPSEFITLSEDEQDAQLVATATVAFKWAMDEGADQVRVETYDKSDHEKLVLEGFDRVDRARLWADATPRTMTAAAHVTVPGRIWVTRSGQITLYVHETWDSVLVKDADDALQRLRSQLPTF